MSKTSKIFIALSLVSFIIALVVYRLATLVPAYEYIAPEPEKVETPTTQWKAAPNAKG